MLCYHDGIHAALVDIVQYLVLVQLVLETLRSKQCRHHLNSFLPVVKIYGPRLVQGVVQLDRVVVELMSSLFLNLTVILSVVFDLFV